MATGRCCGSASAPGCRSTPAAWASCRNGPSGGELTPGTNEVACDGITANVLLPATTRTERIIGLWKAEAEKTGKSLEELEAAMAASVPTRRMGTIEEFGAVAAFIASQQAGISLVR